MLAPVGAVGIPPAPPMAPLKLATMFPTGGVIGFPAVEVVLVIRLVPVRVRVPLSWTGLATANVPGWAGMLLGEPVNAALLPAVGSNWSVPPLTVSVPVPSEALGGVGVRNVVEVAPVGGVVTVVGLVSSRLPAVRVPPPANVFAPPSRTRLPVFSGRVPVWLINSPLLPAPACAIVALIWSSPTPLPRS